jgi:uncharacterized membrane protein YhaH (DUF805 family)
MAGNNPYAAPKANLATPDSGEIDTTSPFSPKGRFARSTYLAYSFGTMFVMWLLIVAVAGTGFARTDASDMGTGTTVITVVAYLAILVVSTIFGIRRLHDLNWSGWWMVAMYVPIVNIVLAVPVMFFRGTAGSNHMARRARRERCIWCWRGCWASYRSPGSWRPSRFRRMWTTPSARRRKRCRSRPLSNSRRTRAPERLSRDARYHAGDRNPRGC